jgi:ATP-binding cassette subfamily F protein uup
MANDIVLQLKDICLVRGAKPIFSGVDLSLLTRERMALVGPNGVGKSTLLQIISGDMEFDKGERVLATGAFISTQFQEPDFSGFSDIVEWVSQDIPTTHNDEREQGIVRAQAIAALHDFGLEEDVNIQGLSGGEARRAALARVFAAEPDLMLLDEPTNHLDVAAIEALEEKLKAYKGAILLISHDRTFLENVSTSCLWLRNGKAKKLGQSFKAFDEWAENIEQQETRALEKLDLRLKEETHWLSRGVTARRSRNMGRLRRLYEMRESRVQALANLSGAAASVKAQSGDISSKLVLEAKNVQKSYDEKRPLIKDFNLRILRGDRIGIVGPNGIGKSTLIKMLVGELNADSGNIRRAKNLTLSYLDQTRAKLDPKATLWDTFAPHGGDMIMVQDVQRHVAAYAKDFLFSSAQLRQPVGSFSGGERNRVMLALSMARPSNFLVLDEPTNDLDMDTLDVLEEVLANYDGTIILVSHDRAFLDHVVTSTLAPLGDGRWLETAGGWSDLAAQNLQLITHKPQKAAIKKSPPPPPAAPKIQTKLSYKDEYRLTELEKLIPQLEDKIIMLEAKLSEDGLYAKSPSEFTHLSEDLDNSKQNLEDFEMEWLELEEKKAGFIKS